MTHASVLGTLDEPVHAMHLEPCMEQLREKCPDALVVAVDASVGSADHVGYVTLGRGPLKPGLGVSKDLDAVGDLFITGIVGSVRNGDPLMLQSVRLSVVMRLADCISRSICLGMKTFLDSRPRFDRFCKRPMVYFHLNHKGKTGGQARPSRGRI